MKIDKVVIPNGIYCYGVRVNEKYRHTQDTDSIPFFKYYDKVICPYWNNIGNGLIKCEYLNKLSLNLDDKEYEKKVLKYFNGDKAKFKEIEVSLFYDKVKNCGVNLTVDSENDFELISNEKLYKINKIRDGE